MLDMRHSAVIRPAEFRYGAVFVLSLIVDGFLILAPAANWSRAVAFAAGAWVVAVAAGVLPLWLVLAGRGVMSVAIPLALVGGLRDSCAAVARRCRRLPGSLAIYLLVGLAFAWVIGLAARLDPGPYFTSGTDGTQGARVYFSFTVLTTTGFGDPTAARPLGRALAVLEILGGQL